MAEEEKTTEEKNTDTKKLNSRKFIVFVIGCVFCVAAMVYGIIKSNTELVNKSLDSFLFISGFYVAGNSFSKWIYSKKEEA